MTVKRDSIIKGTALLTGAGLIVKILGAGYRIPLSRLIGAEGIGLYQMAYPIYLIFLSLSTAGLPIAISRIIAAQSVKYGTSNIRHIFKAALLLLSFLGLSGTLAMLLFAPWLANHVVADPRAVYAMWALAPAIFFMSLIAAFRGFFQGQLKMGPSALSQVIEQVVRVGVALILVLIFLNKGLEKAAAGAAFGATAGGAAGLCFLVLSYWHQRGNEAKFLVKSQVRESLFTTIRQLVRFALPISLAVILMPLLQTIDSVIVPTKLQSIGYSVQQATALLGLLGNSWAVLYLPMIVTGAISANLVPSIAASKINQFHQIPAHNIQAGLRLAFYYLIPVSICLMVFGKSVYRIIYGVPGIEILAWLAPAVLFLGLEQVSAGILQGLGKPSIPLINFLFGAILKIGVTFITTGLPGLNLAGAALGTVCGAGITATLNLLTIKRMAPINFRFLPISFLAGLLFLGGGMYLKHQLQMVYFIELILVGGFGILIYLGILWFGGGINSRDLELVRRFFDKRRSGHGDGSSI